MVEEGKMHGCTGPRRSWSGHHLLKRHYNGCKRKFDVTAFEQEYKKSGGGQGLETRDQPTVTLENS